MDIDEEKRPLHWDSLNPSPNSPKLLPKHSPLEKLHKNSKQTPKTTLKNVENVNSHRTKKQKLTNIHPIHSPEYFSDLSKFEKRKRTGHKRYRLSAMDFFADSGLELILPFLVPTCPAEYANIVRLELVSKTFYRTVRTSPVLWYRLESDPNATDEMGFLLALVEKYGRAASVQEVVVQKSANITSDIVEDLILSCPSLRSLHVSVSRPIDGTPCLRALLVSPNIENIILDNVDLEPCVDLLRELFIQRNGLSFLRNTDNEETQKRTLKSFVTQLKYLSLFNELRNPESIMHIIENQKIIGRCIDEQDSSVEVSFRENYGTEQLVSDTRSIVNFCLLALVNLYSSPWLKREGSDILNEANEVMSAMGVPIGRKRALSNASIHSQTSIQPLHNNTNVHGRRSVLLPPILPDPMERRGAPIVQVLKLMHIFSHDIHTQCNGLWALGNMMSYHIGDNQRIINASVDTIVNAISIHQFEVTVQRIALYTLIRICTASLGKAFKLQISADAIKRLMDRNDSSEVLSLFEEENNNDNISRSSRSERRDSISSRGSFSFITNDGNDSLAMRSLLASASTMASLTLGQNNGQQAEPRIAVILKMMRRYVNDLEIQQRGCCLLALIYCIAKHDSARWGWIYRPLHLLSTKVALYLALKTFEHDTAVQHHGSFAYAECCKHSPELIPKEKKPTDQSCQKAKLSQKGRWKLKLQIGDEVDAMDIDEYAWYESVIVDTRVEKDEQRDDDLDDDESEGKGRKKKKKKKKRRRKYFYVKIHFLGWKRTWDQWINVTKNPERIARRNSVIPAWRSLLRVGDKVEVRLTNEHSCCAEECGYEELCLPHAQVTPHPISSSWPGPQKKSHFVTRSHSYSTGSVRPSEVEYCQCCFHQEQFDANYSEVYPLHQSEGNREEKQRSIDSPSLRVRSKSESIETKHRTPLFENNSSCSAQSSLIASEGTSSTTFETVTSMKKERSNSFSFPGCNRPLVSVEGPSHTSTFNIKQNVDGFYVPRCVLEVAFQALSRVRREKEACYSSTRAIQTRDITVMDNTQSSILRSAQTLNALTWSFEGEDTTTTQQTEDESSDDNEDPREIENPFDFLENSAMHLDMIQRVHPSSETFRALLHHAQQVSRQQSREGVEGPNPHHRTNRNRGRNRDNEMKRARHRQRKVLYLPATKPVSKDENNAMWREGVIRKLVVVRKDSYFARVEKEREEREERINSLPTCSRCQKRIRPKDEFKEKQKNDFDQSQHLEKGEDQYQGDEEVESSSTDIHGFHNAGKTRALVEADGKEFKLLQWVDVYGNNISRYGTHRRGGGSSRLVWTFLPHPCPPLHAEGRE